MKMERVIALAETAMARGEFPIAAVVFHGDTVIASAHTAENAEKRLLVHAELLALLDADARRLPPDTRRELELYTNLEPCMMCLGAAMSAFVGSVCYALEAPDGAADFARRRLEEEACDSIPSYALPRIMNGVLRAESQALFRRFAELNAGTWMYAYAKALAEM
jgi:tRNA(adenine34) deaminase